MMRHLMLGLAALTALCATPALAQKQRPVTITSAASAGPSQTLDLPLGKSQVLTVSQAVGGIQVGNAEIADVKPLNDHSFYVLGKKLGATNVSVYSQGKQLIAVIDVVVRADVEAVKIALHEMMPESRIEVRAMNDGLALSGTLDSAAKIQRAIEIAKTFAGKGAIVNDLRVSGTQQVMLEVKIAEMQRNVSKSLGFKPFVAPTGGNLASSGFSFSTLDPTNLSNFALAVAQVVSGSFTLQLALDALEQRGAVKILAEPDLVAMSGDTANFLAGGEFPIPVAQSTVGGVPTITIEFKTFGVSLAFTPTVLDGDLINLVVNPEVSELDPTNSITANGLTIPGISTRRARTTVELRDGQSFAIAGLLSNDYKNQLRGIPGAMNIPILGALFRSTSYQQDATELVIIVTPKLVHPVPAGTLSAPTDSFVPPTDAEIFLAGKTHGPDAPIEPVGGGLTGKYGHIIR